MKRFFVAVALLLFIGAGLHQITHNKNQIKLREIEVQSTEIKLRQLNDKYQQELKNKNVNQERIRQLEKEKQDLQRKLEAKANAKRAEQERLAAAASLSAPALAAEPTGPVSGCGDNFYANFIYSHESTCNPSAVNGGGCRGIGQACPGSKLPCGADYACQNSYFTKYAMDRYGSWEAAYNFWVAHNYW